MKPHTIHLADIPREVTAYLSSHPPTISGWILMLLVEWDITGTLAGPGGFGFAVASLFAHNGQVADGALAWILGVQIVIAIVAAFLLRSSLWAAHLHYALRESSFWLLFLNREQNGINPTTLSQRFATISTEVASLLVAWTSLQSIAYAFPMLFQNIGTSPLIGRILFLLTVLVAAWVLSSVLRKVFEDKSLYIAFAMFAILCIAVRALIPVTTAALPHLASHPKYLASELLLFLSTLVAFSSAAFTSLSQADCPIVDLTHNHEIAANLSNGLKALRTKVSGFRVSLKTNDLLLATSVPWTGEITVANVYRQPDYLPIVARNCRFWDLSLFQAELNAHEPFRHETSNGLFVVTIKLTSQPEQTAINRAPLFLEASTLDSTQNKILHIEQFINTVGMRLLAEIDAVVGRRFLQEDAVADIVSIGRLRNELGNQKTVVKQVLHGLLPDAADQLAKLTGASLQRKQSELVAGLRALSERAAVFLDRFDLELSRLQVRNTFGRDRIEKIVRELADLPVTPANGGSFVDMRPNDEDFRERSADFLMTLLGIQVASIQLDASAALAAVQAEAYEFQNAIPEEFEKWALNSTRAGEEVVKVLLADATTARVLFRDSKTRGINQAGTPNDKVAREHHSTPQALEAQPKPAVDYVVKPTAVATPQEPVGARRRLKE